MVAREQGVEALRAFVRVWKACENAGAVMAPEEEVELVAEEARRRGECDHDEEIEVAAVGGEAGQREDGLALEEGAGEYGGVAVGIDEGRKIHGRDLMAGRAAGAPGFRSKTSALPSVTRRGCHRLRPSAAGP